MGTGLSKASHQPHGMETPDEVDFSFVLVPRHNKQTFSQPGMGHEVLGVPLGQGAGQQLQAVLGCLEALENASTHHTHNAAALASRSRVEQALHASAWMFG